MAETPSTIRDYWRENHSHKRCDYLVLGEVAIHTSCPILACADGFTMSVQASSFHYCVPREYVSDGQYAAWEIGYPSAREELLMQWVEDENRPTDTVYAYVPTEVVDAVIAKHGGLAGAQA